MEGPDSLRQHLKGAAESIRKHHLTFALQLSPGCTNPNAEALCPTVRQPQFSLL